MAASLIRLFISLVIAFGGEANNLKETLEAQLAKAKASNEKWQKIEQIKQRADRINESYYKSIGRQEEAAALKQAEQQIRMDGTWLYFTRHNFDI